MKVREKPGFNRRGLTDAAAAKEVALKAAQARAPEIEEALRQARANEMVKASDKTKWLTIGIVAVIVVVLVVAGFAFAGG